MDKKIIIFDFDGTLYSGDDVFSKIPAYISRHRRAFLPRVSNEDYAKIVKENPSWKKAYVGSEIVEHIYLFKKKYPELDISIKDFWNSQNEKPDPIVINENEIVDASFIENLCQHFSVYVVSNSSPVHIEFYMEKFGINPKWFKDVISNRFTAKDQTKMHYYQKILEKENCEPENAFVFGDSVKSDLKPAKLLGMNTCHITNSNDIPMLVKNALNIK